ncbi:MAG: PPOX class F420-dependent oxidoreductase [Chloroflexi bacterium]|nr:PPOX class F420-dependent oxidoreductase [Chloroflexota bacterium]
MKSIPAEFLDLLKDETKSFAILGTLMPNGSPQVTPVWFNVEGEYILINTAKGRQKDRNMRARPQVAMTILDPKLPYRYLQIRGEVVEFTEEGAADHISELSRKYRGHDFDIPKGQVRVTYKILPEFVSTED